MDLELNEDQKAIVDAVQSLLQQHAGPARAIALQPDGLYDDALHAALDESGFMDVARDEDMGLLEAVLVAERVAARAGVVSYGASAVVLAGLGAEAVEGPLALARAAEPGPMRFGAHAAKVLLCEGDCARLVALDREERSQVRSNFMYPMGTVTSSLAGRGTELEPGSGSRARDLWRLALAAEAVGTMEAALDLTVEYVSNRRQFGRAIGSFQAVKHRLAECKVLVEGARWLTYEAAYHGAGGEAVAAAVSCAMNGARHVHGETHQLTGALGFTREHDLHVWSMRLQALRQELGGLTKHRRALAQARWGVEA